eukprot:2024952-Rhodomonas_salina.1
MEKKCHTCQVRVPGTRGTRVSTPRQSSSSDLLGTIALNILNEPHALKAGSEDAEAAAFPRVRALALPDCYPGYTTASGNDKLPTSDKVQNTANFKQGKSGTVWMYTYTCTRIP